MSIESALFAHLTADGSATAAIAGNRVYPLLIPEDVSMPAVAYQRVGGGAEFDNNGANGFRRAQMQITCQGAGWEDAPEGTPLTGSEVRQSYGTAKALALAVIEDLHGIRKVIGVTGNQVNVFFCALTNEVDGDEIAAAAFVRCDFSILYKEV